MSDASLDDARAKLGRAEHHLSCLRRTYAGLMRGENAGAATVSGYSEPVPARKVEMVNRYDGEWFVFGFPAPEIPEDWGVITGDLLHNLRSALDVLAAQLVTLNHKPVTRSTAFPIYDHKPKRRKAIAANLKGMKTKHVHRIESLQPYEHPKGHDAWRLATLGRLNNLDKHQLVHPVYAFESRKDAEIYANNHLTITPPAPIVVEVPEHLQQVEGVLDVLRVLRPKGVNVAIDWTFPVGIAFGSPDVTLGELIRVKAYVVALVESFAGEFV